MNKITHGILALTLAALSSPVFAVEATNSIPEPGALSLLGIGAIAGLVVWSRNRKNKK